MQYVEFRGAKSKPRKMRQGVPQGGVLSPVFFNMFKMTTPPDMVYSQKSPNFSSKVLCNIIHHFLKRNQNTTSNMHKWNNAVPTIQHLKLLGVTGNVNLAPISHLLNKTKIYQRALSFSQQTIPTSHPETRTPK